MSPPDAAPNSLHVSCEASTTARTRLPENYAIRPLQATDFECGYLECLAQLTVVGSVSREQFAARFKYMTDRPDTYFPYVITNETDRIVAAGTLLVEHKFIRACGSVGHVEDIVVDSQQRGKNLGRVLLETLRDLAIERGCYKVILDCEEAKVQFYEKCGFDAKGRQMALYRETAKH